MDIFRIERAPVRRENEERVKAIKEKAQELYDLFDLSTDPNMVAVLPPPAALRPLSIAKTGLEESVMWAVKGLTSPEFNGASEPVKTETGEGTENKKDGTAEEAKTE